jgi:hypothetical protein
MGAPTGGWGRSFSSVRLARWDCTIRARISDARSGAFYTLVPIRLRRRGERRSLRTLLPGVSLRPNPAFNPRPRRLSTSSDAFQLHPDFASYGTTLSAFVDANQIGGLEKAAAALSLDPANANAWTRAVYVRSGFGVLLNTKEEEDALRDGGGEIDAGPVARRSRVVRDGETTVHYLLSFHATTPHLARTSFNLSFKRRSDPPPPRVLTRGNAVPPIARSSRD